MMDVVLNCTIVGERCLPNSFGHPWEPLAEKVVRVVSEALARSVPVEAHYYSTKIGKPICTDIALASWTPMNGKVQKSIVSMEIRRTNLSSL